MSASEYFDSQLEDVADFNSPGGLKAALAPRTAFAFLGEFEVAEIGQRKISSEIGVDGVVVSVVSPALEVDPIADRVVGDNADRGRQADGAGIPDLRAGERLDGLRRGQPQRPCSPECSPP